ncbi:MAG: bifunctional phosphoribosylaminoimidazolecarboxamide formyltransferase/IMP cyclohydrolase [Bacteroidia bacterium]|nr:bifunctional phosphoribosylaminoimidazolecarboxamide formyltransferase/IMP cyclohydrolase [Bacteroidia bacterium]
MSAQKINAALISVYHKNGLTPVIQALHALGVTLYATGGTQTFISELNIPVTPVESITNYPELLDGRVKTLHPAVFGGILHRRDLPQHLTDIQTHNIPAIDLVIVDLYPFEATVAANADAQQIIEKIDIGGISLIRAAAKNHEHVLIIPSMADYDWLLQVLQNQNGTTTLSQRLKQAHKAFGVSAHYDMAIAQWLMQQDNISPQPITVNAPAMHLRYGENPHQQGVYYGDFNALFDKLSGKDISYNNLLDIDAAINLITEFDTTTVIILKHNNACGCASKPTLIQAWQAALAGDPVSAFGGVIITNTLVDADAATAINELFFEVLIAPGYSTEALQILTAKKNRIILKQHTYQKPLLQYRSALNGLLQQDTDLQTEGVAQMKLVTTTAPTTTQLTDLAFALKICKHSKSNTIVLAQNNQLLGSGVGMTSRIDALQHAINKAKAQGFDLQNAVMASDAFFPFPDCVQIAHQAGITAVVQPGGSIKDALSIDYCNKNSVAMLTTGVRHFKH